MHICLLPLQASIINFLLTFLFWWTWGMSGRHFGSAMTLLKRGKRIQQEWRQVPPPPAWAASYTQTVWATRALRIRRPTRPLSVHRSKIKEKWAIIAQIWSSGNFLDKASSGSGFFHRHHPQPPGWNPDDTDAQIEGLLKALNNRSRRPGIWYTYLLRTAYIASWSDPAINHLSSPWCFTFSLSLSWSPPVYIIQSSQEATKWSLSIICFSKNVHFPIFNPKNI